MRSGQGTLFDHLLLNSVHVLVALFLMLFGVVK